MTPADEDPQTQLFIEQLGRLADRINARLDQLEAAQCHHKELEAETLANLRDQVKELKDTAHDHEDRIRTVTAEAQKSQVMLGLFSGGSAIASIAALLKAFLGGP